MRQCTHPARCAPRAALCLLAFLSLASCAHGTLTKEERAQRDAVADQIDAGEPQTSNRERRLRTR